MKAIDEKWKMKRVEGGKRRRVGDDVKRQHKETMMFYQQMKRGVHTQAITVVN